jgi:hypothetical protein
MRVDIASIVRHDQRLYLDVEGGDAVLSEKYRPMLRGAASPRRRQQDERERERERERESEIECVAGVIIAATNTCQTQWDIIYNQAARTNAHGAPSQ